MQNIQTRAGSWAPFGHRFNTILEQIMLRSNMNDRHKVKGELHLEATETELAVSPMSPCNLQ